VIQYFFIFTSTHLFSELLFISDAILNIMADIRGTIKSMLVKGQDPKDYLIEVCRPQCTSLQQKLQRCETALKNMTHADP
jgi:hypothetical protein